MSKKIVVSLGIFLILTVMTATTILLVREQTSPPEKQINPLTNSQAQGITPVPTTLLYEDEAGFSFNYPSALGIYEKQMTDPTYYSEVELSSIKYPGKKLTIKIFDTTLNTVEKWLEKNTQLGKQLSKTSIQVDGMKGANLQYDSPVRNLILVLDSGIMYYFEYPSSDKLWEDAGKMVTSTFKLTQTSQTVDSDPSIIDEGEELIQ